jgi:DNA polymerase-3 subunit delta'
MQFQEVIGQQSVKQHLAEMVEHNRLSHALLFLGKEGSGALPLALAFAQYIICHKVAQPEVGPSLFGEVDLEPRQMPMDSCGVCPACTKAAGLVHPDLHFTFPVITKKSGTPPVSADFISEWREFIGQYPYGNVYDWLQFIGAENKQGNITAHECNDIIRKLSLKSFESPYKILILWMPEYLGKEGNKLLKLIEEPPPNTLFILVAESEANILSTILSRCQLVKVPLLEVTEVATALQARNGTAPDAAKRIGAICEGNYREALHLLQHADEDFYNLLRDWLNATLKNRYIEQGKIIDEISRLGRENQKQFLKYFTHLLEQALKMKVMQGAALEGVLQSLSENETAFAQRLNKVASLEKQQAIIEELDKAAYYIERNANAKILFHALTIRLQHIIVHGVHISV